jgi:AcrR family transcriptional regulator
MSSQPAFTRLDPDGRRQQILDAATVVFSRRPYPSVSMGEVAREAEVTRGLVHHYFGGKPDLFKAVVAGLALAAPDLVRTDLARPIEEVAAANIDSWLDFAQQHRELALMISAGGLGAADPELQEIVDGARDRVIDRMIRNHTGHTEAPEAVRFLLRGYLGLADAAAREWLHTGRATREQVHTLLTTGLLALMRDALPALLA